YIKYHRGYTHSFVGLVVLAAALVFFLKFVDRRLRLRRDLFRRPIRPWRLFWLACLGGLGHLFLDFTNSYGIRPLIPFSKQWFHGDLIFVADPWIWLILGASAVWLTTRGRTRLGYRKTVVLTWLVVGALCSVVVAMALKKSTESGVAIPDAARILWFCGLAVVLAGAIAGWGKFGNSLARWGLCALAIYYGAMWMAHQSAARQAVSSSPAAAVSKMATWPEPANPFLWESALEAPGSVYTRYENLAPGFITRLSGAATPSGWKEASSLDPRFLPAIERTEAGRVFLGFSRFPSADIQESPQGYNITLSDARYGLKLKADLDPNLNVKSAFVTWF
ncbi:MAG TPA: metal-dependent hydrolase, partial [Blastocatellia bacterium]|nr:metal-dependent hydrolase [Blastocatellia bacterium]